MAGDDEEAETGGGDRHQERGDGEEGVEGEGAVGVERDHADEVHGPDGSATESQSGAGEPGNESGWSGCRRMWAALWSPV